MTAQTAPAIDPSLFNMWRCVTAIAHADDLIQPEERAYLEKVFTSLNRAYALTVEQKKTLNDDLETAQDISALLPLVTRPQDKALLVHFSRIVAWADGQLDAAEEDMLNKLSARLGVDINAPAFKAHVQDELAKSDAEMKQEMDASHNALKPKGYLFRALDAVLLRVGIDMLDD